MLLMNLHRVAVKSLVDHADLDMVPLTFNGTTYGR